MLDLPIARELERLPNWADALGAIGLSVVPLLIAIIGMLVNRRLKEIDGRLARSRELLQRRMENYDVLAEWLNDLFCYATYVGNWRSKTPDDILGTKRKIDKLVYSNIPIWGSSFLVAYRRFIRACFTEYGEINAEARLNANIERHRAAWGNRWNPEWDKYFACNDSESVLRLQDELRIQRRWVDLRGVAGRLRRLRHGVESIGRCTAAISYRRDIVQPTYVDLLATIGESLGVKVSRRIVLESWESNLPR